MRNRSKLACPFGCGSSDGATEYFWEEAEKWFTKCHVCGKSKPLDEPDMTTPETPAKAAPAKPAPEAWKPPKVKLKFPPEGIRGITEATFAKFGVEHQTGDSGNELVFHYGPGRVKWRTYDGDKPKEFKSKKTPGLKADDLFGQSLFPPGSAKVLTITEGELDALASYQMQGSKFPVVSLPDGAGSMPSDKGLDVDRANASSAVNAIRAAWDYVNSFDEVVLDFDNDVPGKAAAVAVAELLGRKAKIMHKAKHKDANDYLKATDGPAYVRDWWASKPYSPEGVVSLGDLIERMDDLPQDPPASYHMDCLNKLLRGVFDRKLVLVTGGTGTGKSTFFRALHFHLWKTTTANIAGMYLEESGPETLERFCGLVLGKAAHHGSDGFVTREQKKEAAMSMNDGRLFFWDHFDEMNTDVVMKRITYFVKVLGCKYIFLDHVSTVVVSQSVKAGGERLLLDDFLTKLRHFVEGNDCTIFIIAHVNRDKDNLAEGGGKINIGSLRGSGILGQVPDVIIALERDQQAEGRDANRIDMRVLKNRPASKLGLAGAAEYDYNRDIHVELVEAPL